MAQLTKQNGVYGLRWYDGDKGRTRESLRTAAKREAKDIQETLEFAAKINKHDPWKTKWYDNSYLQEIILAGDYEEILNVKQQKQSIELLKAVEEYIYFKTHTPGEWSSDTTIARHSSTLRNFARYTGISTPVDQVADKTVVTFLKRSDLSDFTINSDVARITSFMKWCKDKKGYTDETITVSKPTPQKEIPDFLYNDELKRICEYKIDKMKEEIQESGYYKEKNSQWWHPLYWILLARTGMRPSELINVKISHIEGYSISVRKGTKGKSTSAKRRVEVIAQEGKQIIDFLTDPRVRSLDKKMSENEYLFGRWSTSSQKRASAEFTEAVKETLPRKQNFKLRDLRNVFAYWFLTLPSNDRADFKKYKLKRMLGHSNSDMSEYYMDTLPFNPDVERLHTW